jgi:hypothetical protein
MRITKEMLIPDIIENFPSTRDVFAKYGICGGETIPRETLEFFARAHQINLKELLRELNKASLESPTTETKRVTPRESIGEILWRRFFKSGIVFGLTGWIFGALNLTYISFKHSYFSLPIPLILSHAHIQVLGWAGLFIMGFAYQAFPRFKFTSLWKPRLAALSLWIAIPGIAITTVSWAFLPISGFLISGIIGSILESISALIFAVVITQTLRQAVGKRELWEKYALTSIFFFVLQSLLAPFLLYMSGEAYIKSDMSLLINRVAGFIAPYQDIELFGFIVMMIFGVSQRFIPFVFNTKEPSGKLGEFSFYVFLVSLLLAVSAHIAIRLYGFESIRPLTAIPYAGLFLSSLGVIYNTGVFKKAKSHSREFKFIRAAYLWLVFSMVLLLLLPVYNHYVLGSFSHNYFGAYRHALTVGFISLMIIGVSSRVTPIMSGVEPKSSLIIPFALINTGNALRVVFQILGDFEAHITYPLTLISQIFLTTSGFAQVIGFSFWAYDIWSTANEGIKRQKEKELSRKKPVVIEAWTKVGEIIEHYPETRDLFIKLGFKEIDNPAIHETLKITPVEMVCKLYSLNEEEFLKELNSYIKRREKWHT